MLTKLSKPYKGLSSEIWILALITLINRAGAMVVPFLSLYLTKYLDYSLAQVGWIMSFYGLGSVLGVYIGGKLTDKIGYYKIMYTSLFLTGLIFLSIQFISSFYLLCAGVFALTAVADAFRPAIWVALSAYSKEENRTRSVTLIRLAINLGFSMGPALGGFIIAGLSYKGLFWVDGITSIIAAIMILIYLSQKASNDLEEENVEEKKLSPYKDKQYLIFWVSMFLIGFAFMQYFSTLPLYYSQEMYMSEKDIGWLLSLNGLLVFLTEMPLVHYLEKFKFNKINIIIFGTFLISMSFLVLNFSLWIGIVVIGMIFMSFGEILGFPFSNSYAIERAKRGNQGAYMAMYSMSFSIAHILGPNIGMHLTENYGFQFTWYVMTGLLLVVCLLLIWLKKYASV
ncbi:MAG: MFS transporter [Bacteroidota bacterium]